MKKVEDAIFQVGQKVKVIDRITGCMHLFRLTQEMIDKFGGKEVTISYVKNIDKYIYTSNYPKSCNNYLYHIKEDGGKFYWSNTMFTAI